jgi:O-succinylhomoserine sulfhydrylase
MLLAESLTGVAQVERVYYPGLTTHAQYELGQAQQTKGGAVVSFELQGGKQAAWQLIDRTELLSITANLGDTRTTITHPYTTTHARWSDEDKAAAGISPGLVRIAVGLEDPIDIFGDLDFSKISS